ncbi:M-phase phosphoprotein 9 isoform X3 [Amia ocellicauda]|uniref:M-phase phosphoprotein 9 isoform X3 n=1 Tax=Amia ocellicauda TaxID=2972642 RepID=UPI003464DE5B
MSTDDSISEDVSSSAAPSHENAETNGGKESEASIISSEDTPSGLAGPEEECAAAESVRRLCGFLQVAPRPVKSRGPTAPLGSSPSQNRNLCLGEEEEFSPGRNLPSINPSPLETLTALVKEIQSSGESNPEVWKNCEGRWLQLFQLVEKQYQDQILAQHEQYQCQIQLIQDEIKALVQLQNRQSSPQSTDVPLAKTPVESVFHGILNGGHSGPFVLHTHRSAPLSPVEAGRPHKNRETPEDSAVTVLLSSGYGTLSASEHSLNKAEDYDISGVKNALHDPTSPRKLSLAFKSQMDSNANSSQRESGAAQDTTSNGNPPGSFPSDQNLSADQRPINSHIHLSQPLTSWAQKQTRKLQKSRVAQGSRSEQRSGRSSVGSPEAHADTPDESQSCSAAQSSHSFYLRKQNDSPVSLGSEASGLTYWKLDENELYRPLPDSFDNGSYLFLQEGSLNLPPKDEPRLSLSLKEIYHHKQSEDTKFKAWDSPCNSRRSAAQVLTLDPTLHMKPPDMQSGFTSPSHFIRLPFTANPKPSAAGAPAISPDSMAEGPSESHTDSDCISNTSSLSAAPVKVRHKPSSDRSAVPVQSWTLPSTSHKVSSTSRSRPALHNGGMGSSSAHTESEGIHSTLTPQSRKDTPVSMHASRAVGPLEKTASLSSLEDPVVLSLVRQNLREKHSRHIADLRAYYELEISSLRQKLDSVNRPPLSDDLEKTNQCLMERCDHLERALTEASSRIRDLENKNRHLEKQLADWPDRYDTANATVKALQQRLDEVKNSSKEKDGTVGRLKARLKQLEEAFHNAYKVSDDKEAQMKKEHKMLQDLLAEYESLGKEHERVKDTLVSTENKLFDANAQISELKRIISKLETQIKQLEHENTVKSRHSMQSHSQPSGAGLYHHPDVHQSPSKTAAEADVSRRKWLSPGADYSIFTGRPLQEDQADDDGSRCYSPPETDTAQTDSSAAKEAGKRDSPLTPVMKALIELDETKGTEGRALRKSDIIGNSRFGSRRPTVSFMEGCGREPLLERNSAVLRTQRHLSPVGPRSSSLPPSTRKATPAPTPTKRDTMITPLSAKSSPKRCPTENFSPGFSHLLGREDTSHTRFDVQIDEDAHASASPSRSSSPRKRLQFMSLDESGVSHHPSNSGLRLDSRTESAMRAVRQGAVSGRPAWEEEAEGCGAELLSPYESQLTYQARLESLADTERLFDELTQEKQQIEAALSRVPGVGGRVTLQARLDEKALEDRLEKINRDLGSIRMILKRFHVLRSSANI